MFAPEIASRSKLVESFVVLQNDTKRKSAQSEGTVFFNFEIMLQGPEFPKSRLRENVEKFAAEHFFKATSRLAYFDGQEWFHPDGEPYGDFFDRAVDYHKNNPRLVERFRAEKDGYINAGKIINAQREMGIDNPAWVIGSPPGEVYRNKSFATRNVTFISVPICERAVSLGGRKEKVYQEYQMYVIPSEEMETSEHWKKIVNAGELNLTLNTLGILPDMIDEDNANFVVATPVLLHDSIELIQSLGYLDFDEVSREADKMLELDKDPMAVQRRTDMIDYFTEKMWVYVSRRSELTEQDRLKLKSLTDVMHDYLSSEGGFEYVGMSFAKVRLMIEGHTLIYYRDSGVKFSESERNSIDWNSAERAYRDYFRRLELNKVTQERRNNAGCPIKIGEQSALESERELFETYSDLFGYENGLTELSANTYTESTTTMECVECPFCHKIVDAIVTSTKIKCPKCEAEVSTG